MNTKTTVINQEQLEAQFAFCDKIAAYWQSQGRTPTAYVETYGCQQNEADSEKLRGYLTQSGYAIVQSAEGADVVVMNTCSIREHAEQRVFGNLGALTHTKRRHPEQRIFLCGCMAGEAKFLGQQVSAVGFSIGFERIFSILMQNGVETKASADKIAVMYDEGQVKEAYAIAEKYRAEGKVCSLYVKPKKMGKFLGKLEERGYKGFVNVSNGDEISLF